MGNAPPVARERVIKRMQGELIVEREWTKNKQEGMVWDDNSASP